MKTSLFKILFALGLVTAFMPSMPFGFEVESAAAQSQPTITTLSAAEPAPGGCSGSTCQITVASATGITASTNSLQQYCLIDSELQQIVSISSTTITVRRSRQGFGAAHVSGAYVICG